MSKNKDNGQIMYSGISFYGVLQIAFIVLKLCGAIDWSWWWVLAPMWVTAIAWIVVLAVAIIAYKRARGGNDGNML